MLVNLIVVVLVKKLGPDEQSVFFDLPLTSFNVRWYHVFSTVAFVVANVWNFQLNRHWTFRSAKHAGWFREYFPFLAVGVLGQLSEALADVVGIEEAFVFGSWAARYVGEVGPPPRDVDVVVVGDVPLPDVRDACAAVEAESHVEVNPVVVPADGWSSPSPDRTASASRRSG